MSEFCPAEKYMGSDHKGPYGEGASPHDDAAPIPVTAEKFKAALSTFASGVTVITTPCGDSVHGMTASAFMSGSLKPPLIVICVGRRARLHRLVPASGCFGVSILSAGQEPASRHFSGQTQDMFMPEFHWHQGVPVLSDAVAALAASLEHSYDCGDHSLFVGRVLWADVSDHMPLLHFRGGYRYL